MQTNGGDIHARKGPLLEKAGRWFVGNLLGGAVKDMRCWANLPKQAMPRCVSVQVSHGYRKRDYTGHPVDRAARH